MKKTTVFFSDMTADIDDGDVKSKCRELHGWTPDAVREVESGDDEMRAFACFESTDDAEMWDKQQ